MLYPAELRAPRAVLKFSIVDNLTDLFQPPNAVGILQKGSKIKGGTMRKIATILMFITLVALALPAFADTLILKSGEKVTGYYQGGAARVIKFQTADGAVKDYDILSVQQIQFGDSATAAAPAGASRLCRTVVRTASGSSSASWKSARDAPDLFNRGHEWLYDPDRWENRHPYDRRYQQREEQAR